jgi:hypothetical protein
MTPPLLIRFTKRLDESVVFELQRSDGSSTRQKRGGAQARFFAVHDLTHYAVEQVMGFERGFYGLVAEGWDLTDFGTPWPRGPLPDETVPVEFIVGCFDTQRAAGLLLTAEECNTSAAAYFANLSRPSPVMVTEETLGRVRGVLSDLIWRWDTLPPGETLELSFPD